MFRLMNLEGLGSRICIMGPSNSGKSTLADAIGRARGLCPIHLDRLYHRPGTNWQPGPAWEFASLHDAAILDENWVMDGNYSTCLPQRLERATGLILLDTSTAVSLFRYVRRSCFESERSGGLAGGRDSVKWSMIRHIAAATRRNRRRYAKMFDGARLPKIKLACVREIARFRMSEGLS